MNTTPVACLTLATYAEYAESAARQVKEYARQLVRAGEVTAEDGAAAASERLRKILLGTRRYEAAHLMQIRRGKASDEEALASIRRNAILVLAVSAMSMEQAEQWSARAGADRIVRAIRDHTVWVAVEGTVIDARLLPSERFPSMWPARCRWSMAVEERTGCG
jgi:hypothetical protein